MHNYNYSALKRHNWKRITARSLAATTGMDDPTTEDVLQRAVYDTSSGGLVNDVFGAVLYPWYNQEHRWLQAIPQVDRFEFDGRLGDTIPKAMRVAHSPVQLDTHSEGGSISTARTMSVEEFSLEVKRSETVIEVADLEEIEAALEDAVGFDELWELQQDQLDLAVDREGIAASADESDNPDNTDGTSAYNNLDTITSLDRAIASQDEENNANDTGDTAFENGALDYGSINRSSVTWGDAYVDHNGTSGNRQLTRALIDDFLNNLADNGSVDPWEESVIFADRPAVNVLSDLMADSGRGTRISFDGEGGSGTDQVNDAQTLVGLAGTTRFRHYDGIPMIPNQNAPSDGIGRIFVLPMSSIQVGGQSEPRIAIENYAAPYMERAGRGQPQGYISQGEYKEKALFLLNHELVIRDMASCGKLRDLAE